MRDLTVYYGQRDFIQNLGTSTISIAASGCYLVSLVEAACWFGKKIDPVELNQLFIDQGIYTDGNELPDNALNRVYPDILFHEAYEFPNDPPTPADLGLLKTLLADPTLYVILEIDLGGGHTHFVSALGVNGMVTIYNPWTKQVEDFSKLYGDPVKNIIKYVVYKGTPVAIDQMLVDQLRGQRDANWSLYQNQLQTTKSIQDQLGETQDKANELQNHAYADEQEINNLKKDVQRATQESLSNITKYQEKLKEDSMAVDIGIKSPSIISDLRNYIHIIADYLRVTAAKKTDKELVEEMLGEVSKLKQTNSTYDDLTAIRSNYQRIIGYLDTKGLGAYLEKNKLSSGDINAGEHIVYFIGLLQPHLPVAPAPVKSVASQQHTGFFSRLLHLS